MRRSSAVVYSVTDPRVFQLMELAKTILTSSLTETRALLEELEGMEFAEPPRPKKRRAG